MLLSGGRQKMKILFWNFDVVRGLWELRCTVALINFILTKSYKKTKTLCIEIFIKFTK